VQFLFVWFVVEGAGDWRSLDNEELHNSYCLPNNIRVSKSSRMRWAGHAARTEGVRNSPKNSVRIPERKSLKTYEQVVG